MDIHENADAQLTLICYEDDGTTPKNIESATLELALILKDKELVFKYADNQFTKTDNTAIIDFTPEQTAELVPGLYSIQLSHTETKKAIQISAPILKVIKTF
jgi:hypothetical protein